MAREFALPDRKNNVGKILAVSADEQNVEWSPIADIFGLGEAVQDVVGAMVSGNTETLISVTYNDTSGKLNFVVDNDLANYDNTNSAFLKNIVEDITPQLGGDLDAQGNDITNLGDVTFKTGATGGTLRTGTSAADKFTLQAYDVNGGAYVTIIEADAGNDVTLQAIADYWHFEDATDTTKRLDIGLSGATTGFTTTLAFVQTADRTITFPDATGTLALTNADHGGLTGLADDDHTQYALLAGRATPQAFAFGNAASAATGYLTSTSNATKGKYFLNAAGTITVDELNERFGVGTATPTEKVEIVGTDPVRVKMSTASANGRAQFDFQNDVQSWRIGVAGIAGTDPFSLVDTTAGGITVIKVESGGVPINSLVMDTTETVFNDSGADRNFRVEGDTDTNLLFVDARTDRVGIGTAAPAQKLDIHGEILFGDSTYQRIKFGNSAFLGASPLARFTVQSQDSATAGSMWFFTKDGDGTDNIGLTFFGVGLPSDITNRETLNVGYVASGTIFQMATVAGGTGTQRPLYLSADASANQLYLGTDGRVGVGATSLSGKLHIDQESTTGAIPVLYLDQADVSEEFIRLVGTSAASDLTQSLVRPASVSTATVAGYKKVYISDTSAGITAGAYYVPFYTLT